jgi:hypothetical protein
VFCSVLIRSLRPYVRPVDALAHERWPRWFPRQGFQTTVRPQRGGHWVYRSVPCRGSIDHTICSSSCKFWHRLSTVAVKSVKLLPVSAQSLCGDCGLGAVGFPGHHHLPGDTRGLVGQRNGGQFRRLALEQRGEPGRRLTAAQSMLDHRGSPDHQHAAQCLIAGARTINDLLRA